MLAYVQFGELFDNVSSGFCRYAGSMLLQFVALVLAIFLLDSLIRRRVRAVFRYWIWMIVLVKLMLPPSLSAPTGIGYWCVRLLPDNTLTASVSKDGQATSPPQSECASDPARATHSTGRANAAASAQSGSRLPKDRRAAADLIQMRSVEFGAVPYWRNDVRTRQCHDHL